jgi:ATP synthase protein I
VDSLPPSARLLGIGFYVAICIVLGTLGGRELDKALDTGVLFTLVGLALGLALALYGGLRLLLDVLAAINRRGVRRRVRGGQQ